MAFKILTQKQTYAVARKLKGLPEMGRCKIIRKTSSKKLPFGELPRGVSVEICREISNGKGVVTARITGSKHKDMWSTKRKSAGLGSSAHDAAFMNRLAKVDAAKRAMMDERRRSGGFLSPTSPVYRAYRREFAKLAKLVDLNVKPGEAARYIAPRKRR